MTMAKFQYSNDEFKRIMEFNACLSVMGKLIMIGEYN